MFTRLDQLFNTFQLSQEMKDQSDLRGRLDIVVETLSKSGIFKSSSDVDVAAEAFYRRLVISEEYQPSRKLIGRLTLVRAGLGETGPLGPDYGLSQVRRLSERTYVLAHVG